MREAGLGSGALNQNTAPQSFQAGVGNGTNIKSKIWYGRSKSKKYPNNWWDGVWKIYNQ